MNERAERGETIEDRPPTLIKWSLESGLRKKFDSDPHAVTCHYVRDPIDHFEMLYFLDPRYSHSLLRSRFFFILI